MRTRVAKPRFWWPAGGVDIRNDGAAPPPSAAEESFAPAQGGVLDARVDVLGAQTWWS